MKAALNAEHALTDLCGLQAAATAAGLDLNVSALLPDDGFPARPLTLENQEREDEDYDAHEGVGCVTLKRTFRLRAPDGREVHGLISEQHAWRARCSVSVGFHRHTIGGWVVPGEDDELDDVWQKMEQERCQGADVRAFVPLIHAVQPDTLLALFTAGTPPGLAPKSFFHPTQEQWSSGPDAISRTLADLRVLYEQSWYFLERARERARQEYETAFFERHTFGPG